MGKAGGFGSPCRRNWEYFALPEGFKEMCQGFNSKTLAAAMIDAGMLLPAAGKSQKPVKVLGNGTMKLYHFPAAALSDRGDDA